MGALTGLDREQVREKLGHDTASFLQHGGAINYITAEQYRQRNIEREKARNKHDALRESLLGDWFDGDSAAAVAMDERMAAQEALVHVVQHNYSAVDKYDEEDIPLRFEDEPEPDFFDVPNNDDPYFGDDDNEL